MKARELKNLGVPAGAAIEAALKSVGLARDAGQSVAAIRSAIKSVAANSGAYRDDATFGELARTLLAKGDARRAYVPRDVSAPFRQWGEDLEPTAVQQLRDACSLPIAVRGALMPDAHQGYGLPIGGVLATRNAVIPYAVGVDIACRMKLSVLDQPAAHVSAQSARLEKAVEAETRFGVGAEFRNPRRHDVMDEDWSVTALTRQLKDKAWSQLGTSGSGNHFVEFGVFELDEADLGLEPGRYLALLSHSGSRGTGATIAAHYSKLAMNLHPELPDALTRLAWLSLDSEEGQEYWSAMELMGKYASANHACIHEHVVRNLGARVLLSVENHHNFAWKEEHDGEQVIVHRKGATPAGDGVVGVIPGSMATTTYIVRGKGNTDSLESAAHGAGRLMSRTKAKERFRWPEVRRLLDERGVTLLSAGLDEVPMAYKDIESVMAAQSDLVAPIARFQPKIVKMAGAGEPPED
jgi:tRNA-splicing ligase RtcB (3'-phosphate/5'-hydroxy nucleic acid ligase)